MSKFRTVVFALHKWLGLHLALFFAFMFLTGALLTLSDEIEKIISPEIRSVERPVTGGASPGQIHDAILAYDPAITPYVISLQPIAGAGDRTTSNHPDRGQVLVWTDPVTAEVLAVTSARNFHFIVKDLHDTLLVPSRYVYLMVSATSFILLYSVVSGLITYRRFWRGWFRRPDAAQTMRAYRAAWHRLLGIWLAPFLLIMALTGIYFFLGGLNLTGTFEQPPRTEARGKARAADFNGDLIDQAFVRVTAEHPWLDVKTVVLPGNERQGILFGGLKRDGSIFTNYTASVHPVSLDVLGMATTNDRGPITDIKTFMNNMHFGTWGGAVTRYLWVALALATAGLLLAGAAIYSARTAPAGQDRGGVRRYWRGMGIIRWGYLVVLGGVIAMFGFRFIL